MNRLSDRFAQQMSRARPSWSRYLNARLIGAMAALAGVCAVLIFALWQGVSLVVASFEEPDTPVSATDSALDVRSEPQVNQLSATPAKIPVLRALNRTETNLADYLSRGYRVSFEHAARIVVYAIEIGQDQDVDPLLILSVAAVESSLNPSAQSGVGAQGLMQVHTRVHADKFAEHGGEASAFDPYSNMRVGTQILKGYLNRTGNVVKALKWYVGASRLKNDGGYGRRVLAEKSRITLAAQGGVTQAVSLLLRRALGPTYWASRKAQKSLFADYRKVENQGNRNKSSRTDQARTG